MLRTFSTQALPFMPSVGSGNDKSDGNPYNADPINPPVVSSSPLSSQLGPQHSTPVTMSAVVSRRPLRWGNVFNWAWGGVNMLPFVKPPWPSGATGAVFSSTFQPTLVQLHDWMINKWLYRAGGYPRNLALSFAVQAPVTRTTGGPGPVGMQTSSKPYFDAVQNFQRATAPPKRYNTTSSREQTSVSTATTNASSTVNFVSNNVTSNTMRSVGVFRGR